MSFQGVTGSSATDVYAISAKQLFHSHGDGNWAPQSIPLRPGDLFMSVWALAPNAVYATSHGAFLRLGGDGRWVSQIVAPLNRRYCFISTAVGVSSPTNL